ncbi:MAG: hypothetical protein IJW28_03975, partial [Clostridia bacterium]|nr:hypothetical protein [Clostridia bacterium]
VLKAVGMGAGFTISFDIVSTICLIVLGIIYMAKKLITKKKINNILFIIISAIVGIITSILFL